MADRERPRRKPADRGDEGRPISPGLVALVAIPVVLLIGFVVVRGISDSSDEPEAGQVTTTSGPFSPIPEDAAPDGDYSQVCADLETFDIPNVLASLATAPTAANAADQMESIDIQSIDIGAAPPSFQPDLTTLVDKWGSSIAAIRELPADAEVSDISLDSDFQEATEAMLTVFGAKCIER